jgi:hypothetical protein
MPGSAGRFRVGVSSARNAPGSRPTSTDNRWIERATAASLGHDWAEVLIGEPVDGVGDTVWSAPRPVVLDMTEAEFEVGYRPVTTYERALPETVTWLVEATRGRDWRELMPRAAELMAESFDYEAEDRFVSGLTAG